MYHVINYPKHQENLAPDPIFLVWIRIVLVQIQIDVFRIASALIKTVLSPLRIVLVLITTRRKIISYTSFTKVSSIFLT